MKKLRIHHRKYRFQYIKCTLATLFFCLLFIKGFTTYESTGENFYHVMLNGEEIGVVEDQKEIENLYIEARRKIASESDGLVFMDTELDFVGEEVVWGIADSPHDVYNKIEAILRTCVMETMHKSYTMKVDTYLANLSSIEEVNSLLQEGIDKYDTEGKFRVDLQYDLQRQFNVLKPVVTNNEIEETVNQEVDYTVGGLNSVFVTAIEETVEEQEMDFEDFYLGIQEMDFSKEIEVVEVYLPLDRLTPYESVLNDLIMDQEVPSVYEVVKGDTLSDIAIKVNIPMDQIIAMNDSLTSEDSVLQIGQQLVYTIPEPTLAVTRTEKNYYEEIYDAEVIIIDVPEWYTTQTEVIQQPSAGFRKIVADEYFVNDTVVTREIVKEEVIMEAVPKIMKRGTKIPPTYIKPLSGGRLSSRFGKRAQPVAGASTYHKGVDWATPIGTTVKASSGGTVARAGWMSGYGYVIFINHPDGKQTRYAHLSKVLVSAGQTVKQGDKIALSGNTGVSSGPHVHFEILVGGKQVDPFKYISY